MDKKLHDRDLHQEKTGCAAPPWENSTVQPPLSRRWMSDEVVENTRLVWGRIYGRELDTHEAMEILDHVRSLAELLWKQRRKGGVK